MHGRAKATVAGPVELVEHDTTLTGTCFWIILDLVV
jgi:hypothetical protein